MMQNHGFCGVLAVLLLALVLSASANDLDTKMYEKLTSPVPCTRWLNSKGQIGCTTSAQGAYGIFWPVESKLDLEKFESSKPKHSHTIVVLSGDLLSEDTVKKLEKISRVKGVVIIGEVPPLEAYSETGHFPEANSTTAGEPLSFEWNIHGHDILHHTYKWPMWSVDDLTSGRIITRARSNAVSGTRHGVLLKQFMFGYKNSATCLHFKFCEPVGGHSVWGLLPAPSSQSKPMAEQKFVMSLSRLDAISIFSLDAIGADSDMSGLIANLAALTTLAGNNNIGGVNPEGYQAVDPSKFKFPVLWAFFEAEHWAYAGSTRFLNDWTNLQCLNWQDSTCLAPHYQKTDFTQLRLENIKAIVEARQVGVQQHSDHSNKLFVHQHTHSFNNPLVNDVLRAGEGLQTLVETASVNTPGLPPSSAFTFLNAAEKAQLTSLKDDIVVIADHKEHYNNRYYGSRYDLRSQLNLTLLTDASTLLARTLYAKAMDVPSSQASFIQVNSTIVSTFLDCLTINAHCPLFASFVPSVVGTSTFAKPSHYHGPFFDGAYSLVGKVAHDYMIYTSRNKSLDSSLVACDDSHSCSNVNARCVLGKCLDSSYVQFHDSYSTGIARNPKGGWTITNPDLENWTEPYWENPTFELIHVGNPAKEAGFLFWAIVQTLLVVVGIYRLRKLVSNKYELMY